MRNGSSWSRQLAEARGEQPVGAPGATAAPGVTALVGVPPPPPDGLAPPNGESAPAESAAEARHSARAMGEWRGGVAATPPRAPKETAAAPGTGRLEAMGMEAGTAVATAAGRAAGQLGPLVGTEVTIAGGEWPVTRIPSGKSAPSIGLPTWEIG